ncbi:MAG: hypothetical protein AB7Q17_10215 [Phycisphaerae bacterium]
MPQPNGRRNTPRTCACFAGALGLALVAGCAATGRTGSAPRPVAPPTAREEAMFDALKALAGEWTMLDEHGQTVTGSVFAVSSNGNVVREVMFPGTDHEMTNVYHLDGPSLLVTHYCAMGNQPRMRATGPGPKDIDFRFDGVTNLASNQAYMGSLRLVVVDADHIEQHWKSYKNGAELADHAPVFQLTRKR